MTISKLTLSGVALICAILVLATSVLSASKVVSYEGTQASCKKFYLGEEILPDHLLYPFVAAMDRLVLKFAPKEERIVLKVNYGLARHQYAQNLLEKGSKSLALSTITKSQKYFNLAAHEGLSQPISAEVLDYLIIHLNSSIKDSQQLALNFTESKRSVIDNINHQNQVLLGQLKALQNQQDADLHAE